MALRRAEFYFAVRDLLVRAEVLGTKLEFDRAGFHIEVLFPGFGADPGLASTSRSCSRGSVPTGIGPSARSGIFPVGNRTSRAWRSRC